MKTVIFDLDGTLADTSGDLIAAANACFEGLGHGAVLDPVEDALTAFHGARAMLGLGFEKLGLTRDTAAIDREYPHLLAHYEANIDTHTRFYPGCLEAVDRLSADGYRIGICTNKPEGLAELLMQRLGVRDRFASLIWADTLTVRKPHPAPFREAVLRAGGAPDMSLLVGDTVTDVDTARAAGVPIVLVGFGPEGDGVTRMAPDAVLPHYRDLGNVVESLIGRTG